MKNIILILSAFLAFTPISFAQEASVRVKGRGLDRSTALNDARRNAISTGIGTKVNAETEVKDMIAIRDAVYTQTQGIVKNEKILSERAIDGGVEVEIEAMVSKDAFQANVKSLAQMVGGIRFLTIVNPELASQGELPEMYKVAVDRINEYLLDKGYRVLESDRYFQILKATKSILDNNQAELSYEQKLGMLADAQMIFRIDRITLDKRPGAAGLPDQTKVSFDVKVYDNCTGELLGTAPLESGVVMLPNADNAVKEAIRDAVANSFVRALYLFSQSMGSWINDGAPYRVRIYNKQQPPLSSRDLREFKNKLTANPDFGGSFELNQNMDGYFTYNLNYRKRPDQMSDQLMDIADETQSLKALKMEVSFQFGRMICLTPSAQKEAVQSLQDLTNIKNEIEKQTSGSINLPPSSLNPKKN